MKRSILLLLIFISVFAKAQTSTETISKKTDTIHSIILNEDRYIWVQVPKKAKDLSRYPVIYVLDGQVFFDEVSTILKRLGKEMGRDVNQEIIVVGIGNIWQRDRDYTPTHISSSPQVDPRAASISGGGEKFISFLQTELFPFIGSRYPASATRLLIGHSLGGLEAMHILLKHQDMFRFYAAIDPSMWWDNQKLLNESKVILKGKTFDKRTLFLAVANTKEMDMEVSQIKKDTSSKTAMIRPSLALMECIQQNKQNKLTFDWKYYKDHHHMTVPAPAMNDALKFFLKSL